MISVSNISVQYSGNYLFDSLSFVVRETDRIGLIGRNGTGKSTLLKIIKGIQNPESGDVIRPVDFSMGYLPQEMVLDYNRSVFDEALTALEELNEVEDQIESISNQIAERDDYESDQYVKLISKLSDLNLRHSFLGGSSKEAEAEKILKGLGFVADEFHRPLSTFSGGWQMRVELAKILLARPKLILLDEPTNHLDIDSIRWLENFLKSYRGAVMLVSHDSRFLDAITNRTMELSLGKVFDMDLSYYRFLDWREDQREQQMAAQKNQQRKIAQVEKFIERFRYKNTLATRVQSKIKQLEKMDRIEVEETDNSSLEFRFPAAPRSGLSVIETKSLSKSYGPKLILDKIDFNLGRGEKVAFVGKNGEGKTTLSKIFAGTESYDGIYKLGHNVSLGYYAQHQAEMLDGDATVFEVIDASAIGDMRPKIRNLLGAFLFSGDAIYKKVKVLSGGEKSRLSLAKLLLQPMNLMILDEPTNHLDIPAKVVLKNALMDYGGALIIVSHDRDFLQGLTENTIEFRDKKIKEYPGDIEEYLLKQNIDSFDELEKKDKPDQSEQIEIKPTDSQLHREKQKSFQREENRLQKAIEKSENDIAALEERKKEIETAFSDPEIYNDHEKKKTLRTEFDKIKAGIEQAEEEWTTNSEQLEQLLRDFE